MAATRIKTRGGSDVDETLALAESFVAVRDGDDAGDDGSGGGGNMHSNEQQGVGLNGLLRGAAASKAAAEDGAAAPVPKLSVPEPGWKKDMRRQRRRAAKRRADREPLASPIKLAPPRERPGEGERPSSRVEPPGNDMGLPEDHELPPCTTIGGALPLNTVARREPTSDVDDDERAEVPVGGGRRESAAHRRVSRVSAAGAGPEVVARRGGGGAGVRGRRRSAASVVASAAVPTAQEVADVELGHLHQHSAAVNLARMATLTAQMETVAVQSERRSLQRMKREMDTFRGHYSTLVKAKRQDGKSAVLWETKASRLQERVNELETSLARAERDLSEMRADASAAREGQHSLQVALDRSEKTRRRLDRDLTEITRDLRVPQAENNVSYQRVMARLTNEAHEAKMAVNSIQRRVEVLEAEKAQALRRNATLQAKMEAMSRELETFRDMQQKGEFAKEGGDPRVAELKRKLRESEAMCKKRLQELVKTRDALAARGNDIQKLEVKLYTMTRRKAEMAAEYESQIAELDNKLMGRKTGHAQPSVRKPVPKRVSPVKKERKGYTLVSEYQKQKEGGSEAAVDAEEQHGSSWGDGPDVAASPTLVVLEGHGAGLRLLTDNDARNGPMVPSSTRAADGRPTPAVDPAGHFSDAATEEESLSPLARGKVMYARGSPEARRDAGPTSPKGVGYDLMTPSNAKQPVIFGKLPPGKVRGRQSSAESEAAAETAAPPEEPPAADGVVFDEEKAHDEFDRVGSAETADVVSDGDAHSTGAIHRRVIEKQRVVNDDVVYSSDDSKVSGARSRRPRKRPPRPIVVDDEHKGVAQWDPRSPAAMAAARAAHLPLEVVDRVAGSTDLPSQRGKHRFGAKKSKRKKQRKRRRKRRQQRKLRGEAVTDESSSEEDGEDEDESSSDGEEDSDESSTSDSDEGASTASEDLGSEGDDSEGEVKEELDVDNEAAAPKPFRTDHAPVDHDSLPPTPKRPVAKLSFAEPPTPSARDRASTNLTGPPTPAKWAAGLPIGSP
mmetsp:Transcript_16828/g.58868  ORF Transcript_16828/g.58868 Transcript_16828/m.58868 type:complete len:1015 (-) Transcript_16828:56-3100(-)